MSSKAESSTAGGLSPPTIPPRIPESFASVPDQRFYALALFGGLQAYKLSDAVFNFVRSLSPTAAPIPSTFLNPLALLQWLPFVPNAEVGVTSYLTKWTVLDSAALFLLLGLRIPGLRFGKGRLIAYMLVAWILNALVFGKFEIMQTIAHVVAVATSIILGTRGRVVDLSERSAQRWDVLHNQERLLGSMTISILPWGTATLNPLSATFCIPPDASDSTVWIPLLLNNSEPHEVHYRIRDSASTIDAAEPTIIRGSQLKRASKKELAPSRAILDDDDEEYDEENQGRSWLIEHEASDQQEGSMVRRHSVRPGDLSSALPAHREESQRIYYLPIKQTGLVELVQVLDEDRMEFRVKRTGGALVVECPSSGPHPTGGRADRLLLDGEDDGKLTQYRCVGDQDDLHAVVRGVGSLSVGWKIGERGSPRSAQHHLIAGIEGQYRAPAADAAGQQVVLRDESDLQLVPASLANLPSKAVTHEAGFSLSHDRPGVFDVEILNVTDSLLNSYHPEGLKRSFEVLGRPSASFSPECANVEPRKLLKDSKVDLKIGILERDARSPRVKMTIKYTPDQDAKESGWERVVETDGRDYTIAASSSGTYSILSIDGQGGKVCAGSIREPSMCVVKAIPEPQAAIRMTGKKACQSDVGVDVSMRLQGTPPFILHYTQHREGDRPRKMTSERIEGVEYRMYLEPSQPGSWTYTFDRLDDANYRGVALDVPAYKQVLQPLGSLAIAQDARARSLDIWTCKTNLTRVPIDLTGTPPFTVDYVIGWGTGSSLQSRPFESAGRHELEIEVPASLRTTSTGSATFAVTFNQITDGNGCSRDLQVRGKSSSITYNVKTSSPTVRFAGRPDEKFIQLVEGASRNVPLRLTGERPWTIEWDFEDDEGKVTREKKTLGTPNEILTFAKRGIYRLVSVKDAHCGGQVVAGEDSVSIDYIGRPEVALEPMETLSILNEAKRQYVHQPMCAGEEGIVTLGLQGMLNLFPTLGIRADNKVLGRGPFDVAYTHHHVDLSGLRTSRDESIRTAQNVGVLHLATAPGQHTYAVRAVGDAIYPINGKRQDSLFTVQQIVNRRPSAWFSKSEVLNFCLGERFAARRGHAQVEFEGQAPFSATFDVREPGSRTGKHITIRDISSRHWDFELPDYEFRNQGLHHIHLIGMTDNSGCIYEPSERGTHHLTAEVVEPARIVAVDKQQDYCVGDLLEFRLQGKAPWSVAYKWNGRTHHAMSDTAAFTRLAEKPGEFEIVSVAHKKDQCQTPVSDIRRTIRDLPTAKVKQGNVFVHEEEQTPIIFTFTGTPPFTFTYTRSELSNKKSPVVKDTQTITGVMDDTYTIYSSQEGQYRVTYISDAFCSYPPGNGGSGRIATGQRLLKDG